MSRYVALLGSINVGGNRVKMDDLKAVLERAGYDNVATVVASGNVLFDHARADDGTLAGEIEGHVKDAFGIASFAAVRNRAELAEAIGNNPFAADGEDKFVHTLFLERPLAPAAVAAFAASFAGPERIATDGRNLYIDYATGVARSQIDSALKKVKLIHGRATARNIRSLRRILERMEG